MTAQPEPMGLNAQMATAKAQMVSQLPADTLAVMGAAGEKLAASGITRNALGVGDSAPDFSLPDQHGNSVVLADLLARGPVVMSVFRGGWCPFCSIEMKALADALPEIKNLGATLVALSPNTVEATQDTDARLDPGFALLSDQGGAVIDRYRLRYVLDEDLRPVYESFGIDIAADNGDNSFYLPIPATYVIGPNGVITAAHLDADYVTRMEPKDIIAALKALSTGG